MLDLQLSMAFLYLEKILFVIDNEDNVKLRDLNEFLNKNKHQNFLIFGFTSQIFKYLIQNNLKKQLQENFSNGILIHGGGWKKLQNMKISNFKFKNFKRELCFG